MTGVQTCALPIYWENNPDDPKGGGYVQRIYKAKVFQDGEELGALLISKHHDYGPKNISDSPYGPIPGLVTRIWDKLARILNLTRNNSTPNNESLEDSFADMANYAIISLLVLRGQWDVEQ